MAKRRRGWSAFTVDEKLEALRADVNVALDAKEEIIRRLERSKLRSDSWSTSSQANASPQEKGRPNAAFVVLCGQHGTLRFLRAEHLAGFQFDQVHQRAGQNMTD
jgi:hypothetical protein